MAYFHFQFVFWGCFFPKAFLNKSKMPLQHWWSITESKDKRTTQKLPDIASLSVTHTHRQRHDGDDNDTVQYTYSLKPAHRCISHSYSLRKERIIEVETTEGYVMFAAWGMRVCMCVWRGRAERAERKALACLQRWRKLLNPPSYHRDCQWESESERTPTSEGSNRSREQEAATDRVK